MANTANIYDEFYQKRLFDEMQNTYERVSNLTSFGFNRRWRRQLVTLLNLQRGMHTSDLMTGSGETWLYLLPRIGDTGQLVAVDFSSEMVKHARQRQAQLGAENVMVLEENALCSSIASGSIDAAICVYGVKTLSPDQTTRFICEIKSILKDDGIFGLVEVSIPKFAPLRLIYLFYLNRVVPLIGKLLLGNPDNYRMLGTYLSRFGDCRNLESLFAANGFEVSYASFFWGCASALVGRKPATAQ
jgi:ubiquinone/menaquinone biosynthesis methyltransferase